MIGLRFIASRFYAATWLSMSVAAFACIGASAEEPAKPVTFTLVPTESSIRFQATHNDEPASGGFDQFTADIQFHPDALAASKVRLEVDMNSVTGAYSQIPATLKMDDWFNVGQFPKAVCETRSFKLLGGTHYQADARLTIKNQSVPITLDFTLDSFNAAAAHITGHTTLKRRDFFIGWRETDTLKDDVEVNIVLSALAKHD